MHNFGFLEKDCLLSFGYAIVLSKLYRWCLRTYDVRWWCFGFIERVIIVMFIIKGVAELHETFQLDHEKKNSIQY